MTPDTSSIEMGYRERGSRLRAGLVATVLVLLACQEVHGPSPVEPGETRVADALPGEQRVGREEARPAQQDTQGPPETPPDAGSKQEPRTATGVARVLQAEASRIAAVDLLSCKGGKALAAMSPGMLRQLKRALTQSEPREDSALTPPPWAALLAFRLEDGRTVFGQLVRSDILRLSWERRCPVARAPASELWLDEADIPLSDWLQQHLGPTREKAYQLPKEIPLPQGR